MTEVIKTGTLLFVLLNPLLMSIYLAELIKSLSFRDFSRVVFRGSFISTCVFILFAIFGNFIFSDIFQVRFASFLVFGGIVFLIIGLNYVLKGAEELECLRGNVEHLSGSVAMPFMIGPGTVSASVLIGEKLEMFPAIATISLVMLVTFATISLFKLLHDFLSKKNEKLVKRYLEISGRLMALFIGTYAIEMIFKGIELWLNQ